jgi:hypothetical protein
MGESMKITATVFKGRKAWEMDNGELTLTMTHGGGHIASVRRRGAAQVNPLWVPVWKTIEPWTYHPRHAAKYDSKLLASICGHNLCLGWFGGPSAEEAKAGMVCHGEAPVAHWRLIDKHIGERAMHLTVCCDLPVAQMRFGRTLTTRPGSSIVDVSEQVLNLSKRDVPFTMCEHVTLGPPFLEKGVTVFDMPATKAHTFPGEFSDRQRLKANAAFTWPSGPGADGKAVDLRTIAANCRQSSDFSAQLVDPKRADAWFSAVNPKLGLLIAYIWKRSDFPWIGNWEENFARKSNPWAGQSLTRGMEFANTPFPVGLRKAVTMGQFQGQPAYRWLPAHGRVALRYSIILLAVPKDVKGVAEIRPSDKGFHVDLMR